MSFDPSRYLASEGKTPELDPRELCFGFGRRFVPLGSDQIKVAYFIPHFNRTCPGNLSYLFGVTELNLHRTPAGLHLADASVFISCAMSLAVFDISKCVENGVALVPVHENTTGTIRYVDISSASRLKVGSYR